MSHSIPHKIHVSYWVSKIHIKKEIYYYDSCKKGIILCHFIKKQSFTQVIKPKWSLPMPTNSILYLLEKIE